MGPCHSSSRNSSKQEKQHCRVSGCNESHNHHFCKFCRDADSNHFSDNCPKKLPEKCSVRDEQHPKPPEKCRVRNCQEQHSKHFCKVCKNDDVDHFSSQCPTTILRCKVPECTEGHPQHYCRFCENKDSTHFAKDCPEARELCHATRLECLEMDDGIREIGLKPQKDKHGKSRFGEGIYLAEERFARELVENYYGENQGVLLKCKVWLGKCKDYGANLTDPDGNWSLKENFDSCTAIHPQWYGGKTSSEFREWVIKQPRKARIYSLTFKNTEFKMVDYIKDHKLLEDLKNQP